MTDAEWNAIVAKWERCRNVLGTDGFNEIITALRAGRRYRGVLEMIADGEHDAGARSIARAALLETDDREAL